MLEQQKLPPKEHKRLSIMSDIIIFICIIFVSTLLIQKLDITSYDEKTEENVDDVVSLVNTEIDDRKIVEQENETMILDIKNKYGISVLYGEDVKDFANRLEATEQNDIYVVNNNLKIITKALEKYPISAFYMSIQKTNPIYIMLVDKFENDNIALASRNSLDEYRMYISNTEKFERSFHHEMYHILEYYMASKDENIYYSWEDLNPIDFKYNQDVTKLTQDYVYIKEENNVQSEAINDNAYFLTRYSKTTEKEDRAEIFAELMILENSPLYLKNGRNLRRKVELLQNTIDENVTKEKFHFDKYITD